MQREVYADTEELIDAPEKKETKERSEIEGTERITRVKLKNEFSIGKGEAEEQEAKRVFLEVTRKKQELFFRGENLARGKLLDEEATSREVIVENKKIIPKKQEFPEQEVKETPKSDDLIESLCKLHTSEQFKGMMFSKMVENFDFEHVVALSEMIKKYPQHAYEVQSRIGRDQKAISLIQNGQANLLRF